MSRRFVDDSRGDPPASQARHRPCRRRWCANGSCASSTPPATEGRRTVTCAPVGRGAPVGHRAAAQAPAATPTQGGYAPGASSGTHRAGSRWVRGGSKAPQTVLVVALRMGGAGGIALTAWALRGAGLDRRTAARRVAAFLVLLYGVFFAALLVDAAGLAAGILRGRAPLWLTLTGVGVGGSVIGLSLAALLLPGDLERRAGHAAVGGGRLQRLASWMAPAPAVAREAVALALRIVRKRPSATVAAVVWWACDIAVLWSTFEMFGAPPPTSLLVLCYFLGKLLQLIPLPGGVGPVEGGMVAAFAACGTAVALAVLAVLAYQAISTWLPAAPGVWGYLRLRRRVAAWQAPASARPPARRAA